MSHFLFIAGALRERSSEESAYRQLSAGLWGLGSPLIRDNLHKFLTEHSHGLVYVLKKGICADFLIIPPIEPYLQLDDLIKDELKAEARYGFVRLALVREYDSSVAKTHALLQSVLNVPDPVELNRRLNLGMHRLTDEEYLALREGLQVGHDQSPAGEPFAALQSDS